MGSMCALCYRPRVHQRTSKNTHTFTKNTSALNMLTASEPSASYSLFASGESYLQFVKNATSAKHDKANWRK